MADGDITLRIRVTPEGLGVLDSTGQKLQQLNDSTGYTIGRFTELNSIVSLSKDAWDLFSGAIDFVKGTISGFIGEAEQSDLAIAKLNGALKSTNQFSASYSDQLQELAQNLQQTTRYTEEQALNSERLMVSFGATRGQVERLTKAAADLASGLGIDLDSATRALGKALEGNFSALQRYGIHLSDDIPPAQKLAAALRQIEERFGGQAVAEGNTYIGLIDRMFHAFDDVEKQLGKVITSSTTLQAVLDAARKVFTDLSKEIEDNRGQLTEWIKQAVVLATQAAQSLIDKALDLAKSLELPGAVTALEGVKSAIDSIAGAAAASTQKVEDEFTQVNGVWTNTKKVVEEPLKPTLDASPLQTALKSAESTLVALGTEMGEAIGKAIISGIYSMFKQGWSNIFSWIAGATKDFVLSGTGPIAEGGAAATSQQLADLSAGNQVPQWFDSGVAAALNSANSLLDQFGEALANNPIPIPFGPQIVMSPPVPFATGIANMTAMVNNFAANAPPLTFQTSLDTSAISRFASKEYLNLLNPHFDPSATAAIYPALDLLLQGTTASAADLAKAIASLTVLQARENRLSNIYPGYAEGIPGIGGTFGSTAATSREITAIINQLQLILNAIQLQNKPLNSIAAATTQTATATTQTAAAQSGVFGGGGITSAINQIQTNIRQTTGNRGFILG